MVGQNQKPGAPALCSPSTLVWSLHWTSAFLVVFLLATSISSGLGITTRFFPARWMDLHLSVGVALLVATAVRVKTSHPFQNLKHAIAYGERSGRAVRSILLFAVFLTTLTGLAIFQKPPFGRSGLLFGYFPMPTLLRLDHSIHNMAINLHILLSCIIAILIVAHVAAGFRRVAGRSRSLFAKMVWPRTKN